MSVAWISEARERQSQDRQRRESASDLAAGFVAVWFREFAVEVESIVSELNRVYREKFDGELRLVSGPNIELRCGPNPVFDASLISTKILKVTRYKRIGSVGEMKVEPDHYTARLDPDEVLYFETKTGQPVPANNMGQELLAYLT
ncbi:MAG: hypothetical protein ACMG6H_05745, partial [Acidobacteriota bacterium]